MDNLNSITYADDWKNANEPVYYQPPEVEESVEPIKKKDRKNTPKPLLTLIQIIICVILVASAYCLNTFGGDLYKNIRKEYYRLLNDEIILSENFKNFDLDSLFNGSED